MSNCSLTIVLDQADRHYRVGDTITGKVIVIVDEQVTCKGLTLQNSWKTHGRGNIDSGDAVKKTLFSGTWFPGKYEYAFTIDAEEFPLSYHGNYLNIDWYLQARADIPWAIDPKCKVDYLLTRGESDVVSTGPVRFRPQINPARNKIQSTPTPFWGIVALTPLIIAMVMILDLFRGEAVWDGTWIVSILFLLTGLITTYAYVSRVMVHRKLGDISCVVSPQQIVPGGDVAVSVGFRPKSNGLLNSISFTVTGKEVVSSGSGSNRKTYRNTFFNETFILKGQCDFRAGKRLYEEKKCTLPINMGQSFKSNNNEIRWTVTTHIDIDSWPDWRDSRPFLVV